MSYGGIAGVSYFEPGIEGLLETQENAVFYGDSAFWNVWKLQQSLISGASRDSANPKGATILRAGLAMAFNTMTRKWQQWVQGGMNGTGKVSGILFAGINTQHNGADRDRDVCAIAFGQLWRSEGIILPGEAAPGLSGATDEAAFRTAIASDMPWVRLSDIHEQ